MKRVFFTLLALAAVVSCAPKGEQSKAKTAAVEAEATETILTRGTAATSAQVTLSEQFTSEIEAYKEVGITPAASGVRIDKILFEIGDRVKEGAIVATLDPTLYDQQMITVSNLQDDYNRLEPVFNAGGISQQTIDQAKTALNLQREIAANIKKNIEIKSPISGVITERNAEAGDLFANQAILRVADIDRVKILANISEQYFPVVKVGMAVELRLDIYPDDIFDGKVSRIYPKLNADSRTFTVEVTASNSSMKLRPGMFAHTTFNMGSKQGVMIPDVAVQKQFGSAEHFVYVDKGGVAERRRVVKGRQVGDMIDILSGVELGDVVLVTAFSRLSDGAKINLKK